MKQYQSRLIVVFVVLCTLSSFALASDRILQSEKTTDTISIQPTDGVLFEVPKGVEACSHDYYTHTFGETVKCPMDDFLPILQQGIHAGVPIPESGVPAGRNEADL